MNQILITIKFLSVSLQKEILLLISKKTLCLDLIIK